MRLQPTGHGQHKIRRAGRPAAETRRWAHVPTKAEATECRKHLIISLVYQNCRLYEDPDMLRLIRKIAIPMMVVVSTIIVVFIAFLRIAVTVPAKDFGGVEIDSWGTVGSLKAYAEFKQVYALGRTGRYHVVARTIEGDPIIYTYVNAGVFGLAVKVDNTQDRFGGVRAITVRRCFIFMEYKTEGGLTPFCL